MVGMGLNYMGTPKNLQFSKLNPKKDFPMVMVMVNHFCLKVSLPQIDLLVWTAGDPISPNSPLLNYVNAP